MKKSYPKFYRSESWKMDYYFCVGWGIQAFKTYMLHVYDIKVKDLEDSEGRCIHIEKDHRVEIVVWTRYRSCDSVLVHECAHAALWTVQKANWKMDYDNAEPFTYLLESIYRHAIRKI